MNWRKSTYSYANGACVEVAEDVKVYVRDSNRRRPLLEFSRRSWAEFLRKIEATQR